MKIDFNSRYLLLDGKAFDIDIRSGTKGKNQLWIAKHLKENKYLPMPILDRVE